MVAPVRQRPTGIFGWANFILSFPFRFVYSTFMDIFRFTCEQDVFPSVQMFCDQNTCRLYLYLVTQ